MVGARRAWTGALRREGASGDLSRRLCWRTASPRASAACRSLTRAQNEDVVQWLLREEPSARVVSAEPGRPQGSPVPGAAPQDRAGAPPGEARAVEAADAKRASAPPAVPFGAREGRLRHTLYFSPRQSGTSGLFLAKIYKAPLL